MNRRLLSLEEPSSVALADRVRALRASGKRVYALQTGDPDFPTPGPIAEAAARAVKEGATHYTYSRGLPELREAIARDIEVRCSVTYDPEQELLVTCGGVHAYACALSALLNPGQEVLVIDPAWMTHVNAVIAAGGRPVRVSSEEASGFCPPLEDWEQAITPRTVALVVSFPNNPTGAVATRDYLVKLNELAARKGLYVISDEVYDRILFDGRGHTCFASLPGAQDRTLLVNSFSKTYAMTGWRVGYLAGPACVIQQALKVCQNSVTCVAPFVQQAALAALTDPEVDEAVRAMGAAYAKRRQDVLDLLARSGVPHVRVFEPGGAFYLFFDVRAFRLSSQTIARRLLDEAGVALVPGDAYGPSGEGYLRMTIAANDEEIQEGLRAFLNWSTQNTPGQRSQP